MAGPHTSIEIIDLTEDASEARYSRLVIDPAIASLASTLRRPFKEPTPNPDIKPIIDLDAANPPNVNGVAEKTVPHIDNVSSSDESTRHGDAYSRLPFLKDRSNEPTPGSSKTSSQKASAPKASSGSHMLDRDIATETQIKDQKISNNEAEKEAQKSCDMAASNTRPERNGNVMYRSVEATAKAQQSLENAAKKRQENTPPSAKAVSRPTSSIAVNVTDGQRPDSLTPEPGPIVRRESTISPAAGRRETMTTAPPIQRTISLSGTPQERKHPDSSPPSKRPQFQTPQRITLKKPSIPAPVLQSPPQLFPPPVTNTSKPSTPISSSTPKLTPPKDSDKPPTPVSRSPSRATLSNGSYEHSTNMDPSPAEPTPPSPSRSSKSPARAVPSLLTPTYGQLAGSTSGPVPMDDGTPTASSFGPDFDRGRFPYQRRRRGPRGAPVEWESKGHHKKKSSKPGSTFPTPASFTTEPRSSTPLTTGLQGPRKGLLAADSQQGLSIEESSMQQVPPTPSNADLLKKVVSDAVREQKVDYKHWDIDLEEVTSKVIERVDEWASKESRYFITRLNQSSDSVPNTSEEDQLQGKIAQTFFEEAQLAQTNVFGQSLEDAPQVERSVLSSGSGLTGRLRGGEASAEEANYGKSPTGNESIAIPLASPLLATTAHADSHQQLPCGSRSIRAAAGAATSRIAFQYRAKHMAPNSLTDSSEKRWCDNCEVWIKTPGFGAHEKSIKHQENTRRTLADNSIHPDSAGGSSDTQNSRDMGPEEVREKSRRSSHEQIRPEQPVSTSKARHSGISSPMKLQPRRKILRGANQSSLAASLAVGQFEASRPYQGRKSRGTIDNVARVGLLNRDHSLQHVDFTAKELEMIKGITVKDVNGNIDVVESLAKAYGDPDSILTGRDKLASIAHIQGSEMTMDQIRPAFTMVESRLRDPNAKPTRQLASLLRHRELGSNAVGSHVETQSEMKIRMAEDIRPWRSFMGASHDVVAVAWAPDSMIFGVGAVAHSNAEDLQYNRPCNLMLGDLRNNTLTELPDHRVDRTKPETGPNSTQDMYNACDPKVYKTVTSLKFHPNGREMYTASEDRTVKIWDTSKPTPICTRTLRHDASVTSLDISAPNPNVFATASQKIKNAIRVFAKTEGEESLTCFTSSRAELKPEWKMYPEGLHWGPTASTSHLLLGGFQEYGREKDCATEGHLCLWDVNTAQDLKLMPASQAIHAAAWHPTLPYFASGGAPGFDRTHRSTKTVLRAWDLRYTKRLACEYECPAREMTDVTFSPMDHNIVTAGCTNSFSYVWDWRWPNEPLHQLRHGKSVMPNGEKDTGVMMSLWGIGSSLYYTGSSDGSVRAWDIRRHPIDVLVHSVAQLRAGVQSGAFSPDGTHLLVGDATGGVHVLSSAPWDPRPSEFFTREESRTQGTPIDIIRAPGDSERVKGNDDSPGIEGIKAGMDLIITGQLTVDPVYGPGKGPNYGGPYALQDRQEKLGSDIGRLKREIYKQQPFSRNGEIRPERANPIRILAAVRRENLDKKHEDVIEMSKMMSRSPGTLKAPKIKSKDTTGLTPQIKAGLNQARMLSTLVATPTRSAPNLVGPAKHFAVRSQPANIGMGVIDNLIPESEMLEENGWWPQLGEEEIAEARAKPERRFD